MTGFWIYACFVLRNSTKKGEFLKKKKRQKKKEIRCLKLFWCCFFVSLSGLVEEDDE